MIGIDISKWQENIDFDMVKLKDLDNNISCLASTLYFKNQL